MWRHCKSFHVTLPGSHAFPKKRVDQFIPFTMLLLQLCFSSSHRFGCGNPGAQGSRGRGRSATQTWRNAPAATEHTKAACLLWQACAAENPCDLLCFVVLTYFSSTLRCFPLKQARKKEVEYSSFKYYYSDAFRRHFAWLSKEIGLKKATLLMLWRGREKHRCRNNKYDCSLKQILFALNVD